MEFELRPWSMDDLDDLVAAANNFKIAKNMMDIFPHPYHHENGKAFIEMTLKAIPPNIMAIVVEGKASGGIGIHPQHDVHRKNAELGYWLAEPLWGKGIVPKAVGRMVRYAFDNFDINRIFARPFGTNKASQRVLEKAGFILEAKFDNTVYKNNEYQDELVYAIRRPKTI